jgi:hypothetical protein
MDFSPASMSLAFPPMPYSLQQHSGVFVPPESQLNPYMPSLADGNQITAQAGHDFQDLTNYFEAPFDEVS